MQDFILAKREEIAELCRKHHVLRLSVFGSAARDDFDPATSDVDLLVAFEPEANSIYARNYYSLRDNLETLLHREVDLVGTASFGIVTDCGPSKLTRSIYMQRSLCAYLQDVIDAAQAIHEFSDGLQLESFGSNELVRSAVERKFEIIGEALRQASQFFPGSVDSVPDLKDAVNQRHRKLLMVISISTQASFGERKKMI